MTENSNEGEEMSQSVSMPTRNQMGVLREKQPHSFMQ